MITEEQANDWIHRIRRVDWYYNYSDDYGVWARGQAECEAIRKSAANANLTDEEVQTIIDVFLVKSINEKPETVDFVIERIKSVFNRK